MSHSIQKLKMCLGWGLYQSCGTRGLLHSCLAKHVGWKSLRPAYSDLLLSVKLSLSLWKACFLRLLRNFNLLFPSFPAERTCFLKQDFHPYRQSSSLGYEKILWRKLASNMTSIQAFLYPPLPQLPFSLAASLSSLDLVWPDHPKLPYFLYPWPVSY